MPALAPMTAHAAISPHLAHERQLVLDAVRDQRITAEMGLKLLESTGMSHPGAVRALDTGIS